MARWKPVRLLQEARAWLAASTAVSTSSAVPCVVAASTAPVAGLRVSYVFLPSGCCHALLMKRPNLRLWSSSQLSEDSSVSGAKKRIKVVL